MNDSKSLNHNPLNETDTILSEDFYGNRNHMDDDGPSELDQTVGVSRRRRQVGKTKPTHYKVICISMYTKDIDNLNAKVAELKRRGYTKANKSQLIRMALNQLDIDTLPPPQQ